MAAKTVGRWLVRLVLLCLLGAIAFSVTVLVVVPRAVHGVDLTVLTGSMTPTIPQGSVVVDRPVDTNSLHVGDIATYQVQPGSSDYITHRIVKIDASKTPVQFTFKGDANRGPDIKAVPATAIRGRVWFHVPYLGGIRDTIQTKGGLAGVAMVLLAGYALFQVAGAYKDRRNTKTADSPAEESPAPAAGLPTNADAVDLVIVRRRLTTITTLTHEEIERLGPHALVQLLGGAFLDARDETFTARVAELTAHQPAHAPAIVPEHQVSAPADAQEAVRIERYPVPFYALPHDTAQASICASGAAGLERACSYAPPLIAVPDDMQSTASPPSETAPIIAVAPTASDLALGHIGLRPFTTTPLEALRSASFRSPEAADAMPDVQDTDDVRPVHYDGLAGQDGNKRDEEHARV